MNKLLLGLIGATALLTNAGSAFAYPASKTNFDIKLNMAGASAQDKNIRTLFTDTLCASNTTIFLSPGGKNYSAVSCKLGPNAGSLNGKTVLFRKRSAGGSGQGVNPLVQGASGTNQFMDVDRSCTGGASGGTVNCTGPILETGSLHVGVSDVNPELFKGVNTPAGLLPVENTNGMTIKPAAALIFGIPVTTNLYEALQEAQQDTGRIPSSCAIGNDTTEACMPSLSKAQVATLLSGQAWTWNDVKFAGQSLIQRASNNPSNPEVRICRRVNGSGTQAQANAKFLHTACVDGAFLPATKFTQGPNVIENSGSGDVTNCLKTAQNQNVWAVGIQSTEKQDPSFQFVKIDGVAPTGENTANGLYMDWVELTYQWRNSLGGNNLTLANLIVQKAADPAVLAGVNASKATHSWGIGGYLAVSQNFAPPANGVFDPARPVTAYTHKNGKLNNCISPVVNPTYGDRVPML